ncbi:MAG: 4Fe-4S binding protein [Elusimicrobia bacterium]|nr:4Fe-4S binding protein [Elusimicrobiota bacterium]
MSADLNACSRRGFFQAMFKELASTAGAMTSSLADGVALLEDSAGTAVRPPPAPFVRPPGAAAENDFLGLCTRCDECVKACPEWVVRKAGPEFGRRLEGYPVLLPAENPCVFCAGLPCIAACKTGALVPPAAGAAARIGLAVVDGARCYMGRGQPCDYCVTECPVSPKAVALGVRGAAAAIDAELCTGCGECAQICPANAITIEAKR